jgi:hypothetical protein
MFAWLLSRTRRFYKSDKLFIVKYLGDAGDYYIGSFDTADGHVETRHTLEAIGRTIESTIGFRDNRHLPIFERVGLALKELGYDTVRTIGAGRAWYFDRTPSTIFVCVSRPSQVVEMHCNVCYFARAKVRHDNKMADLVEDVVSEYKKSKAEEST